MNRRLTCTIAALCLGAAAAAAQERLWDFETPRKGLHAGSPACGVVAEPGPGANHAFQIVATKAHHTRLMIQGSEKQRNFVLTFRVRVLEWTGAAPTVYAYGALDKGGMRILSLGRDGGGLSCWYGKKEHNPQLGQTGVRFEPQRKSRCGAHDM